MSNSSTCELCKQPAKLNCSACNEAFYCNKDHQKSHWKVHKSNCAPYKVLQNETLGRYIVATRDIKQGEIIMKKIPLLLGPKTVSPPICLGCHKKLNFENPQYVCSKCKWPLCEKKCENSRYHAEECKILKQKKYHPQILHQNRKQSHYAIILPLRALFLKHTEKSKYEILQTCQKHLNEHMQTQIYQILKQNLIPLIRDVLKINITDDEEILGLCSIFDTNSFEVRDSKGFVNIRGLYPIVSLLSHNCKHNAKHSFKGDDFQLILFATVPINKGDLITTTYTQTLWSTLARRSHLKQSKLFDCVCERCKDPTEYGTYAGSILCNACKKSKIISTNPLDDNADWKCESCGNTLKGNDITLFNESLKREINLMDKTDPINLEDFLIKYKDVLHPTNSYFLEINYALTQMYGNMKGYELEELPDFLIERKIQLCEELLKVSDLLEPGYSRFRGSLLYDLQAAMVVQCKRDFLSEKNSKKQITEILSKSSEYLREASEALSSEPDLNEVVRNRLDILKSGLKFLD